MKKRRKQKTPIRQERVEEALRLSEERYKKLLDLSPDMIVIHRNEKIIYINAAGIKMLGASSAKQIIGKNILDIVHPDFRSLARKRIKTITGKNVSTVPMEAKVVRIDRKAIDVETAGTSILYQNELAVMSVIRDISKKKEAEKKLQEAQIRLYTLLENLPNVVFYETGPGRELVSENIYDMLGYEAEVFKKDGDFFPNLIHPSDRKRLGEKLNRWHRANEPGVLTEQFRVLDKKGNYKWVEEHIVEIKPKQGDKYMSGIIIDVTDRKKSEEQLQLLAHAFESTTEMINIADLNNRFKFVNKAFLDKYGYKESEIMGKDPSLLSSPKNPKSLSKEIFEQTLKGGWNGELVNRKKDGTEFPIYLNTSRITDREGNVIGLIGVARDITESKETEKIINKRTNEIKLLYEAGKMLSGTLEINALYDTMFELISEIADCNELFVSEYNPQQNSISYIYLRSKWGGGERIDVSKIPPIPLAPEGFGIISGVIRSGKPLILNDYQEHFKKSKTWYVIDKHGDLTAPKASKHKPRSAMLVPIKLDNHIFGVVHIYSETKNSYTNEQLNIVEALMHQVALAMNNAVLYRRAQDEIRERKVAEELTKQSLHEKELLLKEIHHRVKNNLQVVSSLLKLQSEHIKDRDAFNMFVESQNRVKSMALIHQKLYQSKDIGSVNFCDYIQGLTTHLRQAYNIRTRDISVELNVDSIFFGVDTAIPCGLIINELFTNCLKHAFPDNMKGKIYIELKKDEDKYKLIVRDTGIGLPKETDFKNTSSLGMELVSALTEQLGGSIEIKRNDGTEFQITFRSQEYEPRVYATPE